MRDFGVKNTADDFKSLYEEVNCVLSPFTLVSQLRNYAPLRAAPLGGLGGSYP